MRRLLGGCRGIALLDPCSHRELVRRMRDADLVLSDSGGMQEEAPALGTPLLVLREKTERPEAIDSGNALLIGTSAERIAAEVGRLTADPAARQAMRATAAHNALRVDGQEIARLGGDHWLWRIEDDAHPRVLRWESDAQHDLLEVEHDGYCRLPRPVVHRRRIVFDKPRRAWQIDDTLDGQGEHLVELFFHPAVPVEIGDRTVRLRARDADVLLIPPEGLELRQESGWISRAYGHREPATVLVYSRRARAPVTLTTRLVLDVLD
jgi:hypothetical protein